MLKKLLLVEDDLGMREELSQVFREGRIYPVIAGTGEEAHRVLEEEVFNAALVDIKLPDCSGVDLILRLRRKQPQCSCILMTAYGSLESAIQALKNGAMDYLLKPFNPEQAVAAVRRGFDVNEQLLKSQSRVQEMQHAQQILEEKIVELRKLNQIFLGREERVLQLQREVSLLRQKLGEPPLYNDY